MPIYEYECHACGHRLEKLQKISDPPLTDCPACEEAGLRKLVSAAAFRLKGGGWYETDFKDEKSRRNLAGENDKPGASGTEKIKGDGDKSKDKKAKTDSAGASKETDAAKRSSDSSPATSPPAA